MNEWSLPETELFDRIRSSLDEDVDAVLVTVIDVEGSAYRRPGAKMLIRPDGGAGSITAGCLEDEVKDLATDVLDAGTARVETWDLTGDDDVWGMGVGCNGVITVLLEPLTDDYTPVVDARNRGDPVAVATVVDGDLPIATRGYYAAGEFDGDLPIWVCEEIRQATERLLADGGSDLLTVSRGSDGDATGTEEASVDVFVNGIRPPPEVVVFGSGHDVRPVVELATLVDFRVTVVAFRGGHIDDDRLAGADEVISASPHEVADLREWDGDTYAVVMTHNFVDDRITIDVLLETPVPYLGLMGPRKRFAEMREAFAAEGRTFTDAELERIYTPIGVNLGGDSPYQIAYSIVAELLAVANDRDPCHLTDRAGPIHDRVEGESS
ncbi:xanthine dehydrogenase accessory factor [Halopenitus persicus]|uniref:Xanthine dehydrogenase accessory factor n=2 Tax=Halopenitus persicus TaxID=1048396 RepID=A0A1H3NZA6_9EURY|nr:XdhC/CoxI family protein [Halopenitus persicus]SDY94043.1 xanthine dehydrogenase accessory factor [Halopenitus persicus]